MKVKKKVYIFRHGETDWNAQQRFQGSTDIPLNENGRAQARELAQVFKKIPVEIMLSSDLKRAEETARIILEKNSMPMELAPDLRETRLGVAEGMTHLEIIEQMGKEVLERWHTIHSDQWDFAFPGGETKREHLNRVMGFLENFLMTRPFEKVAVSAHGGVLRRVIHFLNPHLTTPVVVHNCALYELDFDMALKSWQASGVPFTP